MIVSEPIFIDIEPNEIWVKRRPNKGEHIRVSRSLYNHHGVYITDDEVIHFTGQEDDSVTDWSSNEVISTNLERFLIGGNIEVKEYTEDELDDLYPVEHIVDYARACLGDKEYNLVFNNCEHFANVCTLGRFKSSQVDKVLDIFLNRRRRKMGLFSWVGSLFKGKESSGGGNRSTSSTNTNYTYEPDKVRVAEIESETKIRLAHLDSERITLMTNAQIDVLEKEYYCKVALEEAKARGFNNIANTIVAMQEKLNDIAYKRMEIIEKGSISVIKEIEGFYSEIGEKIEKDNYEYRSEKLPKLLETLEKFDTSSGAYKLFAKSVEEDMERQKQSNMKQVDAIMSRQHMIIESFLNSKDKMVEQTTQITAQLMDKLLISNGADNIISNNQPNLLSEESKKLLT